MFSKTNQNLPITCSDLSGQREYSAPRSIIQPEKIPAEQITFLINRTNINNEKEA